MPIKIFQITPCLGFSCTKTLTILAKDNKYLIGIRKLTCMEVVTWVNMDIQQLSLLHKFFSRLEIVFGGNNKLDIRIWLTERFVRLFRGLNLDLSEMLFYFWVILLFVIYQYLVFYLQKGNIVDYHVWRNDSSIAT